MPAATVLAELLKNKVVEIAPDDRISRLSTVFVPQVTEAAVQVFDATVSDHIRIVAENTALAPGEPRQFDQVLRYSHLSAAPISELKATAETKSWVFLDELNTFAHQLQVQDAMGGEQTREGFVSGIYIATTPPDLPPLTQGSSENDANSFCIRRFVYRLVPLWGCCFAESHEETREDAMIATKVDAIEPQKYAQLFGSNVVLAAGVPFRLGTTDIRDATLEHAQPGDVIRVFGVPGSVFIAAREVYPVSFGGLFASFWHKGS